MVRRGLVEVDAGRSVDVSRRINGPHHLPLCVLPSDGPRGRPSALPRVPAQAARRPPGGRGDDDQTEVDDICGEPRKYPHGSVLSRIADGEPPAADRPLLDGPGSWVCRRSVCPLRTVPFVAQRTVVALGLLGARGLVDGQARGLPAMVPGLEHPSAQRQLGDAQLTRELGDGRAARAQPAHRLGPELRRVRRTRSWHRAVPSGRPRPRCPGLRVGQSLTPSIGQRRARDVTTPCGRTVMGHGCSRTGFSARMWGCWPARGPLV